MSDQQNAPEKQCIVKTYLGFIDTNVLFKKPVSCLFAIVSLLIPVYFLIQLLQYEIFQSKDAKLIIAGILILAVLAFAGIFGAFIWWHRRIIRDEGPKYYDNFRCFIQTMGEWIGTLVAIIIFGSVIILMLLVKDNYYFLTGWLPLPSIELAAALFGPIAGFVIIIATKIFLFLLDPIIWLIRKVWGLFVRIVKYFYRCVTKICGTVEQNSSVWSGVVWLLAVAVVITGLILCFKFTGLTSAIALVFGLAFMAYLIYKKKHYDATQDIIEKKTPDII
jgi:hypothetical protein